MYLQTITTLLDILDKQAKTKKEEKSTFHWFTFISLPTFPPTYINMFWPSLSKGCFKVGSSILL